MPAVAGDLRRPVRGMGVHRLRRVDVLAVGVLVLALFALLGSVTWRFVDNDGVAYLSIARHYADGRLGDAVNGYWSPLLSWIAAPLVALDLDAVLVGRVVQAGATIVALVGLDGVARSLGADRTRRLAVLAVAAPILVAESLRRVSPDLLSAGLALVALGALLTLVDPRRGPATGQPGGEAASRPRLREPSPATPRTAARPSARSVAALVVAAALAALAKLFVGVVLGGIGLLVALLAGRFGLGEAARRGAQAVAVGAFGALVAWGAVLSVDAGRPVLSTSLEYHVRALTSEAEAAPSPEGLAPPPHETSVTPWETPLRSASAPSAGEVLPARLDPTDPGVDEGAAETLRERAEAMGTRLAAFARRWPTLTLAGIATGVLALVSLRRRRTVRGHLVVGVVAIWSAAVAVTWVEPRYLYTPFLLLLAAGLAPSRLRPRRLAAVVALAIAALTAGVYASLALVETELTDVLTAAGTIERRYDGPVRLATVGGGNVAAQVCVHLEGCASYGRLQPSAPPDVARRDLGRFGIDALVVDRSRAGSDLPVALGLVEVGDPDGRWRVYDVSGRADDASTRAREDWTSAEQP